MKSSFNRKSVFRSKNSGFTLVESLLASVIIVVFSASMFGFLTSLKRLESDGQTSSRVDAWIQDRSFLLQSGSAVVPTSPLTYTIPTSYVGDSSITVTETLSTAGIPSGYPGLGVLSISTSWSTAAGTTASRNLSFVIFNPSL